MGGGFFIIVSSFEVFLKIGYDILKDEEIYDDIGCF